MIEISDFYFVLAIRLRQETIFYPPMHLAYTHRRSHCYHVTFANQICVSFSHDVPAIKLRTNIFLSTPCTTRGGSRHGAVGWWGPTCRSVARLGSDAKPYILNLHLSSSSNFCVGQFISQAILFRFSYVFGPPCRQYAVCHSLFPSLI